MTGLLIAIVGPSGVGKDTVMDGLCAAYPDLHAVRRVITRAPDAGGETFEPTTVAAFQARVHQGDFALHWGAHGLFYGVPASVDQILEQGQNAIVNLSRGVLTEAKSRFPTLRIVALTAPTDVLAARLTARGRETADDIAQRLTRAAQPFPPELNVVEICNHGPLSDTIAQISELCLPQSHLL